MVKIALSALTVSHLTTRRDSRVLRRCSAADPNMNLSLPIKEIAGETTMGSAAKTVTYAGGLGLMMENPKVVQMRAVPAAVRSPRTSPSVNTASQKMQASVVTPARIASTPG